jgi:hypothetical protein
MGIDRRRRSDHISKDRFLGKMFDEQGRPQMYANILLSTDGSDVARKGVKHGIFVAHIPSRSAPMHGQMTSVFARRTPGPDIDAYAQPSA